MNAEDVPIDVGSIDLQGNGAREGLVLGRGYGTGSCAGTVDPIVVYRTLVPVGADGGRSGTFRGRNLNCAGNRTGGPQKCRGNERDDAGSSHLAVNTLATACVKYPMFSRRNPATLMRLSSVM